MLDRRTVVRMLIGGAGAVALLAVVVGAANAVVLLGGRGAKTDPRALPHAQAALVLGALVQADGRPSGMLEDRIRSAAALYRDGRVDKVLASGDHGRPDYDEVNAMRRELVALGVPDADIFTDHAGFATLDSVVRARKVFNVRSVIVVTQPFHMPRALWLARRAGLTAYGLDAGAGNGYGSKGTIARVREVFARTKAVGDIVTGAQPKFLGPRIDIAGSAAASRG
jgi:SanA protein